MQQNLDRFKFRWYDLSIKFMAKVISLNIEDDYAIVSYSFADEYTPDEEVKITDGLLMQSTGLRDKNGKLIFEGDIIQMQSPNIKGLIFFDDFYCSMKIQAIDNNGDYQGEAILVTKCFLNSSVIIGNIYEHHNS